MYPVNETLKAGETSTVHCFERNGLGKSPFQFTGMSEKVHTVPGGPSKAGSSCDYCWTCIRYEFWLLSADGKQFKVGSDCIHKSGDAGLVKQISAAERKLRDEKNKWAREVKWQRKAARIEAAKVKLPTIRETLASKPHPAPHFARQGATLLDYVDWCMNNRAEEKAAGVIESH